MYHNESIYALIPEEKVKEAPAPRYRSKYPSNAPPTASTFGKATASQIPFANMGGDYEEMDGAHRYRKPAANFGTSKTTVSPTAYLKKSSNPPLPAANKFAYQSTTKPALDTKGVPLKKLVAKNYIKENALQIIMSQPKRRDDGKVDYLKKPGYGKRPEYLQQVENEIKEEQEYIRSVMMQEDIYAQTQPKMRLLSEEDRLTLLDNLKSKWETTNQQYQLHTHCVDLDTIGKTRRKEEFESQLQQLEKNIEKMSKKNIFVQEDQPLFF